jgi:hypothetical protein
MCCACGLAGKSSLATWFGGILRHKIADRMEICRELAADAL